MRGAPEISVLIPTRGRIDKLVDCARGLALQTVGDDAFEVIVGVDGPDDGETDALSRLDAPDLRIEPGDQAGPASTRNRIIELARGRWLLLLNDDVIPQPGLIERHLAAQKELVESGRRAMVLGSAPWVIHKPDRLFDRLIRETSMVFFYDRMSPGRTGRSSSNPSYDWGFRHAWTLNLSIEADAVRQVGGFCEGLPGAAYEDIELAWRVRQIRETPVLYRPEADVAHNHRYEPAQYLRREEMLGRDAWTLAGLNPACARELFGRDVRSEDEIGYSRHFVVREARTAEDLRRGFMGLADAPADVVTGTYQEQLLDLIYQQHLLLKRWHWRAGLLEAAGVGGLSLAGEAEGTHGAGDLGAAAGSGR